jgi:hypothetical protein
MSSFMSLDFSLKPLSFVSSQFKPSQDLELRLSMALKFFHAKAKILSTRQTLQFS